MSEAGAAGAAKNGHGISYGEAFRLAWPASVAASVTPLLGAIDVWALGRSERPLDIAAIGLGSVIFSLTYWTFGFIRMSVAGLAAQAAGAGDEEETRAALLRGAMIGGGVGLALVVFQGLIGWAAFAALSVDSNASAETFASAREYFSVRIWGAPFVLASYASIGWLTARGRTDYLMIASLVMTGLNIVLDYWFVVGLGLGAGGVAAGTLIAEIAGFVLFALFVLRIMTQTGGLRSHWSLTSLWRADKIRRTLSVNFDIFVRTIILAFCFAFFVQRGGAFGDVTLAANQALLQLFMFTGLALDGTAIAAESLVGRALGDRDKRRGLARYRSAVRRTSILAFGAAAFFAILYAVFGNAIVGFLTGDGAIRDAAARFLPWVAISPLMVVVGFQLDGIFIGATRAREMRDSMIVTSPVFILAAIWLSERYGNHGLWAAFSLYFFLRGITLGFYMPRIAKDFGTAGESTL